MFEQTPPSGRKQEILYARKKIINSTMWGILLVVGIIALGMWGCPNYRVWQQTKEGQAELRRAEQNRQIKILEADAVYQSSAMLSQADTVRAHGIARSNQIIGESLTPAYLHWFWIDNIDKSDNVIYVPTEANLPIMEATRLLQKKPYEEIKE